MNRIMAKGKKGKIIFMAFNKNTIRLLQNIFLNTFYSFNVRQNFMKKKKRAGDNWKKSEIIKMASTSNREKGEKKKRVKT